MVTRKFIQRGTLSAVLLFFAGSRAQIPEGNPWDSSGVREHPERLISLTKAMDVDALTRYLERGFKDLPLSVTANKLDLYLDARGRIDAVRNIAAAKPGSPKTKAAFGACSLSVEAALLQMQICAHQTLIDSLQNQRYQTMCELTALQEKFAAMTRSKVSQLKSDLDEEKLNAQRLRAEAEKKFAELQSALIQVSQDARGTIISMSDLLFEIGKADLTPDLQTSLAKIAGILLVFKNSRISVEGHTDNIGGADFNQKLSENRAENVMSFLIVQGIAADRLSAMGYGFIKPVADNGTKEGRQKNRRVDLIVQEIK